MRREVGTLGPEREGGVYLGMILGKVDLWRGGERLLLLSGLKERSRMLGKCQWGRSDVSLCL